MWLPPLAEPPSLDDLLGGLATVDGRGVTTAEPIAAAARCGSPVALVDKPYEQRRDTAWFDLSGASGHVAIVGGPQSGKSTAVRTLVTALALTHTPREVQIYCLDFGGGSLGALRDLPHVGGVAGRLETAAVRRTVGEVATLLADRERRFAAHGIDSIATFRRLRRPTDLDATVAVPEDGFGDVFLVVDGWTTLRNEFEDLEARAGRRGHPGAELRHPPGAHRDPMERPAPERPGPARLPAGAAAGRPGRLDRSTGASRRTCRRPRPGAASSTTVCTSSPRCPRSTGHTPAVAGQA